jgi:DnaA family protein
MDSTGKNPQHTCLNYLKDYNLSQLSLPIKLDDNAVFENYLPGQNQNLINFLKDLILPNCYIPSCWLWGQHSSGKSHLLQATCERFQDNAIYLPMEDMIKEDSSILDGMNTRKIICIDDIHLCAQSESWELSLFELFNRLKDFESTLLVSSLNNPMNTSFNLADLSSRFSQYSIFKVQALNDEDCKLALQLRAKQRGIQLPDEVASYLLSHQKRDMSVLYNFLDKLDKESLAAKRNLTLPFVRLIMNQSD